MPNIEDEEKYSRDVTNYEFLCPICNDWINMGPEDFPQNHACCGFDCENDEHYLKVNTYRLECTYVERDLVKEEEYRQKAIKQMNELWEERHKI